MLGLSERLSVRFLRRWSWGWGSRKSVEVILLEDLDAVLTRFSVVGTGGPSGGTGRGGCRNKYGAGTPKTGD